MDPSAVPAWELDRVIRLGCVIASSGKVGPTLSRREAVQAVLDGMSEVWDGSRYRTVQEALPAGSHRRGYE